MKEDDDRRPLIIREDGRPPISPFTAEETRLWFARYRPNVTLIDLDQIMAERKARSYRERMDAIFGRRSEGTNTQAGDPLVEMPEVVPATESSTTLAASSDTAAVDPLAAEEGPVATRPRQDLGPSGDENVVTDSSLAQNAEEGPVPKRPRKDLGPSSEENMILSSDDDDAGNN
ncbi:hypothetical protein Tco_0832492 [Tanacetum coccineum]